jgi:hypothetical protein
VARLDRAPVGIAVVDERWTASGLADGESTYTSAGPRPGGAVVTSADQDAVPVLSGAQRDDGIELVVTKSGDPSIERRGCAIGWRQESESTDSRAWRGWCSPVWWSGSSTVHASTTAAITAIDLTVDRDSGAVSCLFSEGSTTPTSIREVVESTQAPASAVVVTGAAGAMRGPACFARLPDSRTVLLDIYGPAGALGPTTYVRAAGASSWVLLSDDPFPGGLTTGGGTWEHAHLAFSRGQLILLLVTTNDVLYQYASADLGASFRLVESTSNRSDAAVAVYSDGTILVTYHDTSASEIRSVRIGHAFAAMSNGVAVTVHAVSPATCPHAVVVDDDGTAYVLMASGTSEFLRVLESTDGGLTWTTYEDGPIAADPAGSGFALVRAVASMGRVYVLLVDDQSGAGPRGAYLHTLSGWSNVTPGTTHTSTTRRGFVIGTAIATGETGSWWSAALPWTGITGYTFTGSGRALAGTSADQYLRINTAGAAGYHRAIDSSTTDGEERVVMWTGLVASGGSVTSSNTVHVLVRCPDLSGNQQRFSARFDAAGVRIHDLIGGTSSATLALDMTVRRDWILHLAGTTVSLYTRPSAADLWTLLGVHTITAGGAYGQARVEWGNAGSVTADSHWWSFRHRVVTGDIVGSGTLSALIGKRIARDGYPLPGAGSLSGGEPVVLARLALQGGHVRRIAATVYDIAPDYDHPVSRVFPDSSPSPSSTWRTTSSPVLAQLGVDLPSPGAYDTTLDAALPLLLVRNANVRQLVLEARTSAGAYTTIGTLDLGAEFVGLTYTITGEVLTITGSTGSAARWLHADELVGGYAEIASSSGAVLRPILSHGAGVPMASASVTPSFRLGGIDGSEIAGSSCRLIHHSGVLVCSSFSPTPLRYWRVRIPSQTTHESYVEAGTIALASVVVPGKRWSRGWSWTTEPNVSRSDSVSGTRRIERLGPERRVLSISWADGAVVERLRTSPEGVDYLSAGAATTPLAGRGDVWWQLEALQSRAKGGEVPVVALFDIPSTTSTVTDPSLYLPGVLEGSVAASHVVGDPTGDGEFVRIESLTVTELV